MPEKNTLGRARIRLPRSRVLRLAIAVALIAGGILGFLPILGFWMIPVGLLILSVDIPMAGRWRRRLREWWRRRGRDGADGNDRET